MDLLELSENQKSEYNRFVATAKGGSFLQSWDWGEWQMSLGREVYRFFLSDDSESIIGAMQLIRMPLLFGKYYFYAPYGPVIAQNFQFSIFNFQIIFNEIISQFPNAIFVRIEPKNNSIFQSLNLPIFKSSNVQPAKTLIIDLSKTEEELLAEMHPKTRYNIRLAQKHGCQIKDEFDISIGHGLFAKEAADLIVRTAKRQGYRGYNADYYYKMIDCLAIKTRGDLKLHIYKAIYHGKLLSSAIMIDFGKTRTFLFGGSSQEDKNVMAPYLLHFQAMLDAKAAGLSQYDFWGVETSRGEVPGFVRFKRGFGGVVKEYAGAYDIINQRFLYGIYKAFRYTHRLL